MELKDAVDVVLGALPRHAAGLLLEHNPHLNVYETVEQFTAGSGIGGPVFDDDDWVSMEEKRRSIETGELWTFQWYPNTPVGFNRLAASTLAALLAGVQRA